MVIKDYTGAKIWNYSCSLNWLNYSEAELMSLLVDCGELLQFGLETVEDNSFLWNPTGIFVLSCSMRLADKIAVFLESWFLPPLDADQDTWFSSSPWSWSGCACAHACILPIIDKQFIAIKKDYRTVLVFFLSFELKSANSIFLLTWIINITDPEMSANYS